MSEENNPAEPDDKKCGDDDKKSTLDFSWRNEVERQQKEKEKIDYFGRVRQNLEISKNLKEQIKRDLAQRKKAVAAAKANYEAAAKAAQAQKKNSTSDKNELQLLRQELTFQKDVLVDLAVMNFEVSAQMIKLNAILISGVKQPYRVLVGYAIKESPLQQRDRKEKNKPRDKPEDKPKDKPKENGGRDQAGKKPEPKNKKELIEKIKRLRGLSSDGGSKKQPDPGRDEDEIMKDLRRRSLFGQGR